MKEIIDRKKELIIRDPLYKELYKKAFSVNVDSNLSYSPETQEHCVLALREIRLQEIEDFYKPFPSMPAHKLQIEHQKRELAFHAHQKEYPEYWEINRLIAELYCKWSVTVKVDWPKKKIHFEPDNSEPIIWIGSPPFDPPYSTTYERDLHYPSLRWKPHPNPFSKQILADINEFVTPGYKGPGKWLPLVIDTSRLNKGDAKWFKKALWEVIESNLEKKNKPREGKSPQIEAELHPQLDFLYSIRTDDTFHKYLKWYDLHMGNDLLTPEGLQFRQIARMNLHDLIKRKCPNKLKEVNKEMKNMKYLDKKTQKKLKQYTGGEQIEWEDAVEKAVKTIYKAIHRKPYPARTKHKLFNCPDHGKDCPIDCKNLKKSMQIFDNRSGFKKHTTTDNADLIADPEGMQPPAKGKGAHTKGLTEYLEND